MAGITISKDSGAQNQQLAAQVAQQLGYCCLADEVINQAAKTYQVSEDKLKRALNQPPSFLERFTYTRDRLLTYIEATLLNQMEQDKVVYCGLAGHFYLKGVPHVLKVRLNNGAEAAGRASQPAISPSQAQSQAERDEDRRRWSQRIFGKDNHDLSLYDLVVNPSKLGQDGAVEMICQAAKQAESQLTPESKRLLRDLALAAQVRAKLMADHPNVRVSARDGVITLDTRASGTTAPRLLRTIVGLAKQVQGVSEVEVKVHLGALYH